MAESKTEIVKRKYLDVHRPPRTELALLKHMFTKAIEWGKVKENPIKRIKLLRGEVRRVRFLMPGEIQTLFFSHIPKWPERSFL